MKSAIIILAVATLMTLLTACTQSMQISRNTTIGQELMDLKIARESNAITEQEYQQLKQETLNEKRFHLGFGLPKASTETDE